MAAGDFATIGGTPIRFIRFRRLADETSGEPERTLSGQRRGDPLWTARSWAGDALCLNDAEADALRVLCDNLTSRLCSGGGFPAGGVLCQVEAGEGDYRHRRTASDGKVVVSLTFYEELAA